MDAQDFCEKDALEGIENYNHNKGWFWNMFLMNASEICEDKEYIKRKYHPEKGKKIDKNDQAEERMEML